MALCPWSLAFITCLSKCRIGDVFKHYILSFIVFYLFRMYEEGGGQMTCYWYVLILLKFLSIVWFWEEIIHRIVPTLRYIFNTELRWYQTLNSLNFVSNHQRNIYLQTCQNDLKFSPLRVLKLSFWVLALCLSKGPTLETSALKPFTVTISRFSWYVAPQFL